MTLATLLGPDQSTQNNQDDLSEFLRRIVADACSRRALANADLRRPSVAKHIGLEDEASPTTVLIGQTNVRGAIRPRGRMAA
jgi:Mrp family chromosome partitioning ATPase